MQKQDPEVISRTGFMPPGLSIRFFLIAALFAILGWRAQRITNGLLLSGLLLFLVVALVYGTLRGQLVDRLLSGGSVGLIFFLLWLGGGTWRRRCEAAGLEWCVLWLASYAGCCFLYRSGGVGFVLRVDAVRSGTAKES
jgi:small-conductance mechanosensitive channel